MKALVSVIIPAYNEADNISQLAKQLQSVFGRLNSYRFEVIIVENGSSDNTFSKLMEVRRQDKRFKIVQLSRNFECDGGIMAGLAHAQGEAAIIMMADLQDPPRLIPEFLKFWKLGYEIVYGIVVERQGISWIRDVNSRIFYKLLNKLTHGLFPENVSDFRLIDKKVYQTINRMPEHNIFFRGLVMWTGFKSVGIELVRPPRFAGHSKADFRTVLTVALNGIFSFSYFPLRAVTFLGIGLLLISVTLLQNIFMALIVFLFGLLFLILGIMGEYLARIYDEVKRRPTFIVKQKIG